MALCHCITLSLGVVVREELKKFIIIDKVTGKEVDGVGLIMPSRVSHPYRRDGVQVRQGVLHQLATHPNLSKRALRIAIWLISELRRGPVPPRSRQDIARALAMDRSDVSKGLQELYRLDKESDSHGVIYKPFLPPGERPMIGVRPSVAWKGNSADLVMAIRTEERDDGYFRARANVRASEGLPVANAAKRAALAPPLDASAVKAMDVIRDMEKKGMAITIASFCAHHPPEDRPDKTVVRKIFETLIAQHLLQITKPSRGRQGAIYGSPHPPVQIRAQEILTIIRHMEKSGKIITIQTIRQTFDNTNRPVPATIRKFLNELIKQNLVQIAAPGSGRQGAVYSSVVPSQSDPSRPPNKAARSKGPKGSKP